MSFLPRPSPGTSVAAVHLDLGAPLRAPSGVAGAQYHFPQPAAPVDHSRTWSSSGAPFHSRRPSRTVGATAQQEQLLERIYDRSNLPVEAQLLSLGPARPRDHRYQSMDVPSLDDIDLPPLSQTLAVPVAPTTGHAGWLMNAQRMPAGAYNASVALESQLQNRGLVAHQRSLQAVWAPAGPVRFPAVGGVQASAAPSSATGVSRTQLGPSPHAEWVRANQPGNAAAFNQNVGPKSRA